MALGGVPERAVRNECIPNNEYTPGAWRGVTLMGTGVGPCCAARTKSKLRGPWTKWVIPGSTESVAQGACAPGCPSRRT
eukprot:11194970-Lingulodinium_polyedra.AAC.1